ncbi:TPA: peptide chain release factor 1 [Candidatus Dependentiae bacterium]|nr:MAG: Peptide chain release factor 1 [candidate division TM6 bacterium GW2011_GWE2_31_21]KKP53181.1 MAG: Peptide chain release factor 1 [candidate division TM6 bacterium GW2011_GWF2_33_332]HBS47999.1 peptide chain release factor 1 [Candidatus Dependentiae bacterium]HBZ73397.1 peptide chain release factor 1 [Candidatus Dependentiae bacterium]
MNWEQIKKEYEEILQKLSSSSLDNKERGRLQKLSSLFSTAIEKHGQLVHIEQSLNDLKKDLDTISSDVDLLTMYKEEIIQKEKTISLLQSELEDLLYPADEKDSASVFIEIRAGAGGQEAALFASDLFKMYSNYALTKRWDVSIADSSTTDLGGFKEIIIYIKGKNVYKYLKFEAGVHRVQRVPRTETAGRIHTSTVTVAVLPEVEEVDVSIDPKDLRIDVFRSSGAGGQHVNTTDSAVRITHIPSGVVVSCQDERSQIKNRAKGMKILQARLYDFEKQKKQSELSVQRKTMIGTGERSEKIRTYNFPQNRITDHRIDLTLKKLDVVIEGDLDDLINPLVAWEFEERKKQGSLIKLV